MAPWPIDLSNITSGREGPCTAPSLHTALCGTICTERFAFLLLLASSAAVPRPVCHCCVLMLQYGAGNMMGGMPGMPGMPGMGGEEGEEDEDDGEWASNSVWFRRGRSQSV